MTKQDRTINAISKCLTSVKLTKEEIDLICNLKSADYLEYDLSIDEILLIKKWCNASQRHLKENRADMNLDYGHHKSDSKEGQMAKRSLLTMAKDMYNLYCTLNDGDDLPEWCHYKLANSRKDLSDITDYITSKIMKKCVDGQISQDELRLEIKKSFNNDILTEGFLDFFKGKNINKLFKDLISSGKTAKSFKGGFTQFLKDCLKLASEIESKGITRSNDNLDYDHYNSLIIIRNKLKAADSKLSKMSDNIVSAKNESFYRNFLSEIRNQNQKSRAIGIKLKLKNKEYSKFYYNSDVKSESMRDIIDCISYDIRIISKKEKLNSQQKKELISNYKNFVESLYNRINKIVEETIESEFDLKGLEIANTFNKMRSDLGQTSSLLKFLEDTNKVVKTFYHLKNINTLLKKVGKKYSVKGREVNHKKVLNAIKSHIKTVENIKSNLENMRLLEANFSKYPDIAANYIGFIDDYVLGSNQNNILEKIKIINNQLNNKYFLESEINMIANKIASSLKMPKEKYVLQKLKKEIKKILNHYCDILLSNLNKCKTTIMSASSYLDITYSNRQKILDNPFSKPRSLDYDPEGMKQYGTTFKQRTQNKK